MNKSIILLSVFISILISNQALATDREDQMWQQHRAQQGMQELDAQFDEPKPESKPEPKVVERVIERVIIKPAPQAQPAPVAQPAPEPVAEPVSAPQPVTQPSMVTAESDGYIFKLGACKLAHRNIQCQLTITSVNDDGELTLFGNYSTRSSKLFDHNGNEYHPSTISMGNKQHKQLIRNKYIAGVTAKGHVEFVNVDARTNSIAMFELSLQHSATNKLNRIQFRDVGLSF